jgi:hypothetical protein
MANTVRNWIHQDFTEGDKALYRIMCRFDPEPVTSDIRTQWTTAVEPKIKHRINEIRAMMIPEMRFRCTMVLESGTRKGQLCGRYYNIRSLDGSCGCSYHEDYVFSVLAVTKLHIERIANGVNAKYAKSAK